MCILWLIDFSVPHGGMNFLFKPTLPRKPLP